jgi:DNA-directed RNA polymerase subunit E'/Rpb7
MIQNKIKSSKKPSKKSSKKSSKQSSKQLTESETTDSTEYNLNINTSELIYPCKDKVLYTKILLNPNQMNNDIYLNLKKNLIEKLEGKCIVDGYIVKVYKIMEYSNGIIEAENFTGGAVFNIKYLAKVCVAIKESVIIGKITEYLPNANFVLAEFGNIIKIIFTKNERDINTTNFTIGNDKSIIHNESQNKLQVGSFVKLQLKTIRYYNNDIYIKCMAYLENLPTKEEIDKFVYVDENNKEQQLDNKQTIYYNEDNEIEEKTTMSI